MAGDNPTTSFDGIEREPSNAEMARHWRQVLAYSVFGLVWLWLQWALLANAWAGPIFIQALTGWTILAVITWRRPLAWLALSLAIALLHGVQAFGGSLGDSLQDGYKPA